MNGLVIGGKVVPCRIPVFNWMDTGLECKAGDGARRRSPKGKIDLFVWHWTGGEGGVEQLFRVLEQRELGVEFFIDQGGLIFQFCDPIVTDTFDAGYVNARSVGCEIANVGTGPTKGTWQRTRYETKINGVKIKPAEFYKEQVLSALALADAVSEAIPTIKKHVPRNLLGGLKTTTMSPKDVRSFSGHIGHYHINAGKTDPGTDLLQGLIKHGY